MPLTTALVSQALGAAVRAKHLLPGLIQHSDRGTQYCAQAYQEQLRQCDMTASMSRRGNYYYNAPMESFWGTLKNELVHHRRYETREQARREIAEDLELRYNRQRRHSRLGNCSPTRFALQWARQPPAASGGHSWRPLLTIGVRLYLAVLLDLYSCTVIGWTMGPRLTGDLSEQALRMTLTRRQPESGLLHHSDRGSQYAATAYLQQLRTADIIASMSRTGNYCDNAFVESFFETLKRELVYHW